MFLQRIGHSLKASKQTVPNLWSAVVCKRLPCATVSLKPWKSHCTARHFIYANGKIITQNLMTFNCLYSYRYKKWLAITFEKLQNTYVWINCNGHQLQQLHFPVASQWVLLWTVNLCISYWNTFVDYIHQLSPVFMPCSHLFSTYGFSMLLPFQCLQWTGSVKAHKLIGWWTKPCPLFAILPNVVSPLCLPVTK